MPLPEPSQEAHAWTADLPYSGEAKDRIPRVLFIDHTAKLGGGEIALFRLIEALDRTVVEPILLTFEQGPLVERLRASTEVHVLTLSEEVGKVSKDKLGLRSALQFGRLVATLDHVWKVRQLIRSLKIDVIHTNSLKSDIIGGLGGRLAMVPTVWHVRDRIAPDYLPSKVVHVFRWLSRLIPTFVVAVSDATLRTLLPSSTSEPDPSRMAVIYDGIELPPLTSPTSDRPGMAPRIGLVGRVCPWKGQHIFLRSAAKLHPSFPQARFEIIGAPLFDEQSYDDELRELCHTLGIGSAVTFTGFIQDVASRMADLDIVVHASIIGEPFGLVIVEGMAQAKPVVGTNGGGVPEIVVHGITGLLVPMGDADAMAVAIASLLEDPERARSMGLHGRQRVAEHFTVQQTAREVEALYGRLLA